MRQEGAGGRFGLNSLIFFHPDLEAEPLRELYEKLCADIASRLGVRAGVGLACWPFLDLRPSDMIEGARKALEYALLLPAPHIGQFGSLALNISADKRHCRGDVFGPSKSISLPCWPTRIMYWRGIPSASALPRLGAMPKPGAFFEEAIQRTPDDPALAYNLGAVCQSLHDNEAAAEHFRTCIRLSPSHLYALIRLGQLDEAEERLEEARARFESAAALDTGSRSRTGILPVSPCGSAKRIRPVSICTRRCSAIPEMWPPSALWPTSTLTAAKIRSLRNRWPARAWPCVPNIGMAGWCFPAPSKCRAVCRTPAKPC